MTNSKWVRLLAYVTGSVKQELLLQNEYLAAENRILRTKLPSRLQLRDPERITLAEIGKRLGRKALHEVACVAKPDTILPWYRRLVAEKFGGSNTGSIQAAPWFNRKWKPWWSVWRERTAAGDMTASSVRWPTWGTACRISPLETFCAATASLPLPSEAGPRRGKILSPHTWMSWSALTSSPWRC